jgi:proteic killer suppression protein
MAIKSFADDKTSAVFDGKCPKGFPAELQSATRRKLRMVDAAHELNDLKVPPNNKLHPLEDNRAGQHAIWVNDKYRICFRWADGDAHEVEFTDYHK